MCTMTNDADGEADGEEIQERLNALLEHASNKVCADCPERNPGRVSLLQKPLDVFGSTLGVFCCSKCGTMHRKLGENTVAVKRVTDKFTIEEVQALEQSGNQFVNNVLEANATEADKSEEREVFIRKKYKERVYFSEDKLHQEHAIRTKANKYAMLLAKPKAAPSRADRLLKREISSPDLFGSEGGLSRARSSRNMMENRVGSSPLLTLSGLALSKAASSRKLIVNRSGSSRDLMKNATWGNNTGDSSDGGFQRMAKDKAGSGRDLMAFSKSSKRNVLEKTEMSSERVASSTEVLYRMAMGRASSKRNLLAENGSILKIHPSSSKWDLVKKNLLNHDKRKSLLTSYHDSDSESEDENGIPTKPVKKIASTGERVKGSHHVSSSSSRGDLQRGSTNLSRVQSGQDLSKGSKHASRSSSKGGLSRESKHLSRSSSRGELSKRSSHSSRAPPSGNKEDNVQNRCFSSELMREDNNEVALPRQQKVNNEMEEQTLQGKPIMKRDRLKKILEDPENLFCSECGSKYPTWASFFKSPVDENRLGVLCCHICYGLHHTVGAGEMTLKSVEGLAKWSESDFKALELSGNTMINAVYESTVGNLKNTMFNHDQGREAFFFEKYINLRYFSGEVYRHLLAQATAKLSTAEMASLEQERRKQQQEECSANKPSSNEGVGKKNKKKRPKKEDQEKKRQAISELKAARKLLEDQEAQEEDEGKLRKANQSSRLERLENQERSARHERPLKKSSSSRSLFDSDSDEDRHVRKSEKKENSMKKSSSLLKNPSLQGSRRTFTLKKYSL